MGITPAQAPTKECEAHGSLVDHSHSLSMNDHKRYNLQPQGVPQCRPQHALPRHQSNAQTSNLGFCQGGDFSRKSVLSFTHQGCKNGEHKCHRVVVGRACCREAGRRTLAATSDTTSAACVACPTNKEHKRDSRGRLIRVARLSHVVLQEGAGGKHRRPRTGKGGHGAEPATKSMQAAGHGLAC